MTLHFSSNLGLGMACIFPANSKALFSTISTPDARVRANFRLQHSLVKLRTTIHYKNKRKPKECHAHSIYISQFPSICVAHVHVHFQKTPGYHLSVFGTLVIIPHTQMYIVHPYAFALLLPRNPYPSPHQLIQPLSTVQNGKHIATQFIYMPSPGWLYNICQCPEHRIKLVGIHPENIPKEFSLCRFGVPEFIQT